MTRILMTPIAEKHRAHDMLLEGTYAKVSDHGFTGCSVGCFLHDIYPGESVDVIDCMPDKHRLVANHFGYPEWLALLQDTMFEGLPAPDRYNWHVQLSQAIDALPETANWQRILHKVHLAILHVFHDNAGSSRDVVKAVMDLHERAASGEAVSDDLWSAARSAAISAGWSAGRSAARSAAYQDMRDGVLSALESEAA